MGEMDTVNEIELLRTFFPKEEGKRKRDDSAPGLSLSSSWMTCEVLPFILKGIRRRHLGSSGVRIIHVDSHPDLMLPSN